MDLVLWSMRIKYVKKESERELFWLRDKSWWYRVGGRRKLVGGSGGLCGWSIVREEDKDEVKEGC